MKGAKHSDEGIGAKLGEVSLLLCLYTPDILWCYTKIVNDKIPETLIRKPNMPQHKGLNILIKECRLNVMRLFQ
jgi:hypothetical protein